MKSNWKMVPLGNVCEIKNGYAFKSKDFSPYGIPVIKIKNVKPNQIITNDFSYVPEAIANAKSKWLISKDEILLTMTGNRADGSPESWVGKAARFTLDGKHLLNQRVSAIKSSSDELDTEYLGYYLSSWESQLYFIKHSNSSGGQANISPTIVKEYNILLPPIDKQKQIVSILRSLDDKIELNNKINENLQQQVAATYKSWYQDFSRVANLPLVETEFGLIPQGWHYTLLGDICKSVSVTHKFDKDKLVFLNTGDIEDGRFLHSNYMEVKDMPGQAKKTIAPGDILYSEIRPINRHFAYVNFPSEDYIVSTKLMVIRANGFDTRRLYHYLTSEDILSELQMQAESRSGTFPQIRFDNVSKLPILIADRETEDVFINLLHTVYNQIEHNDLENKKLVMLRDTLLPKLMSGEIDVSDIQL